jgi:hypothetical protein
MRTHEQVDRRSLALVRAVVGRIDADPSRAGLRKAREICMLWYRKDPVPAYREWLEILDRSWSEVRETLLDQSEEGKRLRQTDPFCGVLTPQERWSIYKEFAANETRGS